MDGQYGIHARVPYAEGFIAHNPQTYKTLPVDDYDTGATGSSMEEVYAHMSQMLLDSYKPRA